MKKAFFALIFAASLQGCATPQQNAALTGAIVGAAVAVSLNSPPPPPPRKFCHSTIYRDQFGNLIRRTTCRE